jgi:hypothetical protein
VSVMEFWDLGDFFPDDSLRRRQEPALKPRIVRLHEDEGEDASDDSKPSAESIEVRPRKLRFVVPARKSSRR